MAGRSYWLRTMVSAQSASSSSRAGRVRSMSLYFKYLSIMFKSQLQYRTSFWLLTAGQFFIPFTVFAGLYFMFERFGQLRGWSFFEVALCYGIIHMAFS